MTSFNNIYESFFALITDDMYLEVSEEETKRDCKDLLKASIPLFEFPPGPLDYTEDVSVTGEDLTSFNVELTLEEINILAYGMVQIWLQRQITTVELIRQKFSGPDFKLSSQAAHLATLQDLFENTRHEHRRLQMLYSRRRVANGQYESTFDLLISRG